MGKKPLKVIGQHRSEEASKNLGERVRELEDLDEMATFEFESPVRVISEWADTKHMVRTLEAYLWKLTIPKLRELLSTYGVTDVPKRLKKESIVRLAHETLTSDIRRLLAPFIMWGPVYLDDLCMLLDAGGRRSYWKGDITSPFDVPSNNFPTLILVDEKIDFTVVAPKEVEEAVYCSDEEEFHEVRELSQSCYDVRVIGSIMADLCGLVSVDEVLDYCFGPRSVPIPDEMFEYLLSNGPWIASEDMWVVSDGTRRYFASFDFLKVFDVDDESDIVDADVVQALLAERARIERHRLDELIDARRTKETVDSRALLSPEGRAFISLLDEHVPDSVGEDADSYSIEVLRGIVSHLRVSDDVSAVVEGVFAQDGLIVQGNLADRILDAVEAISHRIPKWRLNGWSHAEIEELAAKGTLSTVCAAPEEICDHRRLRLVRRKDEASGYLLIRSREEAEPIMAKARGRHLLGLA